MYTYLWGLLPGPLAVRITLAVVAVVAVLALLMLVVFPASEMLISPADDVTM